MYYLERGACMKLKQILRFGTVTLLAGAILIGCEDDKSSDATDDKNQTEEKATKKTLAELGYTFRNEAEPFVFNDNIIFMDLEKDGKHYIAILNDKLELLVEPSDQYPHPDPTYFWFSEGLAPYCKDETREMILAANSNAKLCGFIDTSGKEVIEMKYRTVSKFSNGLALAQTVEEDRDDLSNYRWIMIDKTGKELAELQIPEGTQGEPLIKFGYAYSEAAFYTHDGKYIDMKDPYLSYLVMNDKIIQNEENDNIVAYGENHKILVKDFEGNVLNTFTANDQKVEIYDFIQLSDGVIANLSNSNTLLAKVDGETVLIDLSTMKILLKGISYNYDDMDPNQYLFVPDAQNSNSNTVEDGETEKTYTGTFYDYKGNKLFSVQNMVGNLLNGDRYFVRGNEYLKLVDSEGNVLIDEDQKIMEASDSYIYLYKEFTGIRKFVNIAYRENASDVEPKHAILNAETLEIINPNDLLDKLSASN